VPPLSASPSDSTVSPDATSSPSATPSRSTAASPAAAHAIVVLRAGDGVYRPDESRPGVALPLFWDWISTATGARFNVTPIRGVAATVLGARHRACTLAVGMAGYVNLFADGLPTNSADGRLAVVPCYNVPVGGSLGVASPRTIAVLSADGAVDTRVGGNLPSGLAGAGTGWRQVATVDGTSFWTAAAAAAGGGFRYAGQPLTAFDRAVALAGRGALGGSKQPGYNDARGLLLAVGPARDGTLRLWGASSTLDGAGWATVFSLAKSGGSLPRSAGAVTAALPGLRFSSGASPWGFVFDADGWLWVSVDDPAAAMRGVVQGWRRGAGGTWARQEAVAVAAETLRSLTGRDEAGAGFALYAASSVAVYRFVARSGARSASVVARPPAGTVFRGVVLPPVRVTTAALPRPAPPSPSGTPKRKRG
jgi:hypothetical protein